MSPSCQQNAMGGFQEMRMETMVCPKPRRFGLTSPSVPEPVKPSRCHVGQYAMLGDSASGAASELLDMIFSEGGYGGMRSSDNVASSPPPFFCGSPPVRAHNPVVQDARFGTEMILPFSPPSPSSSTWKTAGPARMKFGLNPAPVRIEGFDCLSLDCGNCSISARA